MGTEVLRPHNCLVERIRVPPAAVFPRRRSFHNNNNNISYNYNSHPARRSRSKAAMNPMIARRYSSGDLRHSKRSYSHYHNHHHQIVRRGEAAVKTNFAYESSQIRIKDSRSRSLSPKPVSGGTADVYAGSAIFVSPSPESLPLPSFSKKKQVDDSATRDLRRLLRID